MKRFNHIFIALTALLLGSYSSYAMDNPNPEDEDIIVESVESDDAFKATGLYDTSQAQKDALKTYILSQKRRLGQDTPVLIQEEIIEQMGNKFAPVTHEMINRLQKIITPMSFFINQLEFNPNGKQAWIEMNNTAYLLYKKDLFLIPKKIPYYKLIKPLFAGADKVQFSPNGDYLLVTYTKDPRHFTKAASLLNARDLSQATNSIINNARYMEFSPNSQYLYVIENNADLKLLHTKDLSLAINEPLNNVYRARFSPDNKYLLVFYNNNNAQLLNIDNFSPVGNKNLTNINESKTTFSPKGDYIFITYNDDTGELVRTKDLSSVNNEKLTNINNAIFKPNNKKLLELLIIYQDNAGVLFRPNKSTPNQSEKLTNIYNAQFSPDGNYLFIIDRTGSATLLKSDDLTPTNIVPELKQIGHAQFSSTGAYLLIKNSNETMLFNLKNKHAQQQPMLTYKNSYINVFSPHDNYLMYKESGSGKLVICLLNITNILNPVRTEGLQLIAKIYNANKKIDLKPEELKIYNSLPAIIKMQLDPFIEKNNIFSEFKKIKEKIFK